MNIFIVSTYIGAALRAVELSPPLLTSHALQNICDEAKAEFEQLYEDFPHHNWDKVEEMIRADLSAANKRLPPTLRVSMPCPLKLD